MNLRGKERSKRGIAGRNISLLEGSIENIRGPVRPEKCGSPKSLIINGTDPAFPKSYLRKMRVARPEEA